MKKFLLVMFILSASVKGFSQSCEEREDKLLGMTGSLSAGFLYNTYGLIGSIADGYSHDAYNGTTVIDLMNAQLKLSDNMIAMLEKIVSENAFKNEVDKTYISSSVAIIKGLKTQVQLFIDLVKNRTQKNVDAYDAQRNKNWKDLSKLMGIKD